MNTQQVATAKKVVCIVGLSPSSRNRAFLEPVGTEMWTCNNAHQGFTPEQVDRFTAWFQIHERSEIEARHPEADSNHIEFLRRLQIPVFMEKQNFDIPTSRRYPIEDVVADLGYDYFTSSIAYMLALAIYMKINEIHLYGVDMIDGSEYEHERPCVEFLLGVAHARGIKPILPEDCPLLKGHLYGRTAQVPTTLLKAKLRFYVNEREKRRETFERMIGQVSLLMEILQGNPNNDGLKALLQQKTKERDKAGAEYNAYVGAIQAINEVLIDALRPENEDKKALRTMGGDLVLPSGTPHSDGFQKPIAVHGVL